MGPINFFLLKKIKFHSIQAQFNKKERISDEFYPMNYTLMDRILALGNLIGHARLGYIEADRDLRVSSWNQGAVQLFGLSEDESMGRFLDELIPLNKRDLQKCKKTHSVSCSHENHKGETIQYDIHFAPIMNTRGDKLGVAVLIKDISGQVKDQACLRIQAEHLSNIFGFAPIGIYHVNMEGKMLSANPEYAWMLGYESAEALVDQITDFAVQIFYDEDRGEDFMFGLYESEKVVRFRCRLRRKDNSSVWALCYAKATHDEFGRMNGFNGFTMDISETIRAEQELKQLNEKLQMLSVMDGLTRIPNRRKFDEYLALEWKRLYRNKDYLSVILCDIDFFKLFNDHYGHQAGDECLQKVARAIHGCVMRPADLAARYGGEEFVIVLPNTDAGGAMVVAEKVRARVGELMIPHARSRVSENVSLSLGIAAMVPGSDNSPESLVAKADHALYEAKGGGRNRSVCAID